MFAFYALVGFATGHMGLNVVTAVVLFALVFGGWLFASARLTAKSAPKGEPLNAIRLGLRDTELLGISIAYLLPVATEGPAGLSLGLFSLVVAIFAGLVALTQSYHVNPMLVLFGWRFYEIETEIKTQTGADNKLTLHVTQTLLSRRVLTSPAQVTAGVQLGPFLWLDQPKAP